MLLCETGKLFSATRSRAKHPSATWQRAAINFYCSSLEVNGPQDDPDTADAAPELVKGMVRLYSQGCLVYH